MQYFSNLKIPILIILILFLVSFSVCGLDIKKYYIKRALEVNHWYIDWQSELDEDDYLTYEQAKNRVNLIFEKAKKLNYMYPDIHPIRVGKDFFPLIEFETKFVKYASMDDGKSFRSHNEEGTEVLEAAGSRFHK